MADVRELLQLQSGVISRRQVEAAGESAADIARRLRRREWVRLLPGGYVDHSGPATWHQRAWAGVLYYGPAVLADESVLTASGAWPARDARVVVAVDRHRNVQPRAGYSVRWVADLEAKSLSNTSPPRMRVEDAALRVSARCRSDLDAVQVLASLGRLDQRSGVTT